MPLELTDAELATAATACRAMAYQESELAEKLENPGVRGPIEHAAERDARLAEKLEAARKRRAKYSLAWQNHHLARAVGLIDAIAERLEADAVVADHVGPSQTDGCSIPDPARDSPALGVGRIDFPIQAQRRWFK